MTIEKPSANALWGGRFEQGPAALMSRINASIDFDKRFYRQDIAGSRAHCSMLVAKGIIPAADGAAILAGLDQVEREIDAGQMVFDPALEDIHMHVEARLKEIIGEPAGRLHTARSRNDQVATDFRLWVRDALDRLDGLLAELQKALVTRAAQHVETVMPGFTHLQAAQPVTFGHHMLAYVEMFARDRSRLKDARVRMNENPLGAAALAGTSFPLDRHMTAAALGFDRPMRNSLDAVSARDFAQEYLAAVSICATHLSRLAEELVIWSSAQFGFVRMSDAFSSGSSIMPQKRNPDAAELVRAKAGRVIGAFNALTIALKGLALTYGKDMQEDKEPVFDAADTIELCVAASAGMILDMTVNADAMRRATDVGFLTATDLADWLVREKGLPFRDAHHVTGRAVKLAEARGVGLEALTLADLKSVHPGISEDVFAVLGVDNSVRSRTCFGGTAPARVAEAVAAWKRELGL